MTERPISAEDNYETIINESAAQAEYAGDESEGFEFEVLQGDVRIGHRKNQLHNFTVRREGRSGIIRPKGEAVYAQAVGEQDALVDVREASFGIDIHAPLTLPNVDQLENVLTIETLETAEQVDNVSMVDTVGTQQNRTGVVSFPFDPNNEQMPSHDVPDNFDVLIQASNGNDSESIVTVGSHELVPGASISLGVDSTDSLPAIAAPVAGDGVNITFEEQ